MAARGLNRREAIGILVAASALGAGAVLNTAPAAHAAVLWNHPFTFRAGITDYFGPRPPGSPGNRFHYGLDYGAGGVGSGTPIYSVAHGTVITNQDDSSYGYYVVIQHADGFQSLYAHMDTPSSLAVGSVRAAGSHIGYVGNRGDSYGAHLHLEIRLNGTRIDPYPYVHNSPLAGSPGVPISNSNGSDLMKVVLVNGAHFLVGARYILRSYGPAYDQTMQLLYGSAITLTTDQFNTMLTNLAIPWGIPAQLAPGIGWFNGAFVASSI